MKEITIQYGDNINFYGVDLSDEVWNNISQSGLAFVNSAYIIDENRKVPIKAVFLNHLANKERNFAGTISDIGMSGPLYRSNYLTCTIDDSNFIWRNILSLGGYESEHGFIELEVLLTLLYKNKGISENTSKREKFDTMSGLTPQEARLTMQEVDELRQYVNFEESDEQNNKVETMILMHFFLEKDFYIVLPYGTYKDSIICTEQGLSEYVYDGKLDASIVYKRSDVLDTQKTPIIVDEKINDFVDTVKNEVAKVTTPQVSDSQLLNRFFSIVSDATVRYRDAIEIQAVISKKGTIKGTLKTSSKNPSSYKKLEKELDNFGKISKKVYDGRTTGIEIEKSIKLSDED